MARREPACSRSRWPTYFFDPTFGHKRVQPWSTCIKRRNKLPKRSGRRVLPPSPPSRTRATHTKPPLPIQSGKGRQQQVLITRAKAARSPPAVRASQRGDKPTRWGRARAPPRRQPPQRCCGAAGSRPGSAGSPGRSTCRRRLEPWRGRWRRSRSCGQT